MKIYILIVASVSILTGCSFFIDTSFPTKPLTYDEAGIISIGPFAHFRDDGVVLNVVSSNKGNHYRCESVTEGLIVFSAFSQAKSPVTYADHGGPVVSNLKDSIYKIKFKNPDKTLVDLGFLELRNKPLSW